MVPTTVEQSPNRVLLCDGDGLAYYCSGNDETDPGEARQRLIEKIASAKRASGASTVLVLLTGQGSHKGHRYALATVKPYQGNRSDSRRPKNWQYLRRLLEDGLLDGATCISTDQAEADDLFAYYSATMEDVAILTQDKDMRMVPGLHLDWTTHLSVTVLPDTWSLVAKDKLYGRLWFWQQLLAGDSADNIPGLPRYVVDDKEKLIGEKTAAAFLQPAHCDADAFNICRNLYESYYHDQWLDRLLEQAALLWLRKSPNADVLDVTNEGNPLAIIWTSGAYSNEYRAAALGIATRIANVQLHRQVVEDDTTAGEGIAVADAGSEVCLVPTQSAEGAGSDGPRPLDGIVPCGPAPDVQRPARQDRELRPIVWGPEPVGFLTWGRALLATSQ
jgi:DNA polymerase-1